MVQRLTREVRAHDGQPRAAAYRRRRPRSSAAQPSASDAGDRTAPARRVTRRTAIRSAAAAGRHRDRAQVEQVHEVRVGAELGVRAERIARALRRPAGAGRSSAPRSRRRRPTSAACARGTARAASNARTRRAAGAGRGADHREHRRVHRVGMRGRELAERRGTFGDRARCRRAAGPRRGTASRSMVDHLGAGVGKLARPRHRSSPARRRSPNHSSSLRHPEPQRVGTAVQAYPPVGARAADRR